MDSQEIVKNEAPSWRAFAASSVGIEMGLYVFLGFFFGRWLDSKLGTDPFLMLVMVILGVVFGVVSLVRASRAAWGIGSVPSSEKPR